MTRHRRLFVSVSLLAILSLLTVGCGGEQRHDAEYQVFGTRVSVSFFASSQHQADQAMRELQTLFQALHRNLHPWQPGPLTEVNQALAAGRKTPVGEHLRALIPLSRDLEQQTGGLFNAAAGGLVALWGFHTSDFPVMGLPPDDGLIEAWLASEPSTLDLTLEKDILRSRNPAVQLDFSAVAKGYAVDSAIRRLADLGIHSALVNAGGDLRAVGGRPEGPWRVAVEDPRTGGVLTIIETDGDDALFTSGGRYRYRQADQQSDSARWPHILDPRDGRPVTGLLAATVMTDSGVLGDAAATALMVAGPDRWRQLARTLNIEAALVVDASGELQVTEAMQQRLAQP